MKSIIKFIALIGESMYFEMKSVLKDSGAILVFFIALIIYPLIYSLAYEKEVVRDIPIAIVDLSQSNLSQKYAQMIDESEELDIVYKPGSMEEAKSLFFSGDVKGIIVIDADFHKSILEKKTASVSVYADATYFLFYKQIVLGALMSGETMGGGIEVRRLLAAGNNMQQAMQLRDPLPLKRIELHNPFNGYGGFVMPGLLIVIIQQTLVIGLGMMGGSNRRRNLLTLNNVERKNTFFNNVAYVLGKFGTYFVIYFINGLFIFVWIYRWFQFPMHTTFMEILPIYTLFLLATTFLGIAIGTLFKHREEAFMLMVFLSPIILFFTGISYPAESIPKLLHMISYILPSQAMVPAYLRLRTIGCNLSDISFEVNMMIVQAIVYFFLAVFLVKRRNRMIAQGQ